jgi:imidazoleglycerol-phosphate dehydratase
MTRMKRETRETRILLEVTRATDPATADSLYETVKTGDTFLDHMLVTLARYAGLGLRIEAEGDMRHHLVEDVAILLGTALKEEVPARATRFGSALIPMDDALVQAAIDVGGRPYFVGRLPSKLYTHFLQAFAFNLGATLHLKVIHGEDKHHIVEAAVKATGLALRQALVEGDGVFSTKGPVSLRVEPTGGSGTGAS